MIIAALLAILTHLVGMALAKLVFRKKTEGNRVRSFVTVYCNCGFMGIPLIEGAVGAEGVIYSSIYIMVFQALLWSHGIITIKGGRDAIKPYKIFVNAGTIGIALGLPLFLLSISLPPVISDTVSHIANLNTPLAMIVSGVYVANSNIKRAFTRPKNYLCVAMRQIAVPLVMMGILLLIPADPIVEITILIISACPVASAVTLFAAIYGKESDLECASRALTLSTLLSVVTIPAITLLYGVLV
jgi:predicted permease